LHSELSIVPRVDTWISIDGMVKKKQEEEAKKPLCYFLEKVTRDESCWACGEGHSIVDCPFGKYHVGRNQPQCKNCGGNHDEYVSCNRAQEYGVKWKQ